MTAKTFSLPHGASGVEVGDFVINFCSDKVVALAKYGDTHYTLHAGHASGVLDLHRTWRDPDGTERHQTVFAMRRSDLHGLLADLSSVTIGIFRLLRRLRLGWLHRNNIGIVWGLDPTSDQEIAAVTRRRRGKKLVVDEDKLRDNTRVPEYFDEIWDFPDGAFSLLRRGRKIGVGIKATDQTGYVHLYWFKLRDISRLFGEFQDHVVAAASQYAIPKERYKDYRVLEP
jgi:hypothetical protein